MRWVLPLVLVWIIFAQGASVFEVDALEREHCSLSLVGTQVTVNGDGDGIADTNQTLQPGISLRVQPIWYGSARCHATQTDRWRRHREPSAHHTNTPSVRGKGPCGETPVEGRGP